MINLFLYNFYEFFLYKIILFQGFIQELVLSFPLDKRRTLIRKELRKNLFNLFAGWAGRFGQIFGFNTRPANGPNGSCTEFEFSALQAMLAVLCSGPSFDLSKFAEEGEVYRLLDLLLASEDINIYNEGQKAVVMLLEVNPDLSPLLDWLVDRCYTGTNRQVSIGIQNLPFITTRGAPPDTDSAGFRYPVCGSG